MEHFIDAFIHQAEQNPDNIAVLDSQGAYTFGELNHRSAFLAELILLTRQLNIQKTTMKRGRKMV